MSRDHKKPTWNRREFLGTAAAAGVMAAGVPGMAAAPKRGGTLRYATRVDGRGLTRTVTSSTTSRIRW